MIYEGREYNVLVVSSTDKFNTFIKTVLTGINSYKLKIVDNIASAKRETLEQSFDFVIINSPLPDDIGSRFAIDICDCKTMSVLLLTKTEFYDEINSQVIDHGVFTLTKPTNYAVLSQALLWMSACRERLRKLEKKTSTIEQKMEEIRIVNRAKWLIIEHLKMTEPDAHRYIEKQAMDRCVSRKEISETIIKTYS